MNDLIDTTEMYLRTIFELEEEGIVPLRARIAERLHQSGPTVSQTVARMERDGLLTVEGDRHLQLSDEGRAAGDGGHAQAPAGRVPARGRHRPGLRRRPRGGVPLGARHERGGRAQAARPCSATRRSRRSATRSPASRRCAASEPLGGETSAVLDSLTLLSTTATAGGAAGRHPADQRAAAGERRAAARAGRPGRAAGRHDGRPAGRGLGQPRRPGAARRAWPQHVFVSAVDEELTPLEAAPLL